LYDRTWGPLVVRELYAGGQFKCWSDQVGETGCFGRDDLTRRISTAPPATVPACDALYKTGCCFCGSGGDLNPRIYGPLEGQYEWCTPCDEVMVPKLDYDALDREYLRRKALAKDAPCPPHTEGVAPRVPYRGSDVEADRIVAAAMATAVVDRKKRFTADALQSLDRPGHAKRYREIASPWDSDDVDDGYCTF